MLSSIRDVSKQTKVGNRPAQFVPVLAFSALSVFIFKREMVKHSLGHVICETK